MSLPQKSGKNYYKENALWVNQFFSVFNTPFIHLFLLEDFTCFSFLSAKEAGSK
jgi:hypothetical protein